LSSVGDRAMLVTVGELASMLLIYFVLRLLSIFMREFF